MSIDPKPSHGFSAADWDSLRYRFQDSLMANTELHKLAQSIDNSWPMRGKDETPQKYLSYTLAELQELPEFYGKGNRLPLLFNILSETLAFDDPFGDMVDYLDTAAQKENAILRALQKLEIPLDLPIRFTNFSDSTLTLCENEGIKTLAELAEFAQKMAKSVVVGGEFRSFLNALAHIDVQTLKRFLPIREAKTGLFLAESLGHLAEQFTPPEAVTLLHYHQLPYSKPSWKETNALSRAHLETLINEIKPLVETRMQLLPDQAQQLRHAAQSGSLDLLRYFAALKDPDLESLAQAIALVGLDIQPKQSGLLKRLFSK